MLQKKKRPEKYNFDFPRTGPVLSRQCSCDGVNDRNVAHNNAVNDTNVAQNNAVNDTNVAHHRAVNDTNVAPNTAVAGLALTVP